MINSTTWLRRERLLPVVTLIVAATWSWGTWRLSGEVRNTSMTRLAAELMFGSMAESDSVSVIAPDPLLAFLPIPQPTVAPGRTEHLHKLHRQVAYVEGVVYIWARAMYGVASLLGAVGLLGVLTRFVRWPQLVAGVVLVMSPVLTIVCMRLLIMEDKGGMEPLSAWSYIIVATAQSSYGFVLVAVLGRRRKTATESDELLTRRA